MLTASSLMVNEVEEGQRCSELETASITYAPIHPCMCQSKHPNFSCVHATTPVQKKTRVHLPNSGVDAVTHC